MISVRKQRLERQGSREERYLSNGQKKREQEKILLIIEDIDFFAQEINVNKKRVTDNANWEKKESSSYL